MYLLFIIFYFLVIFVFFLFFFGFVIGRHLRYYMFQDSFEGKIHSLLIDEKRFCRQFWRLFELFWRSEHPWQGLCSRVEGTNVNVVDRTILFIFIILLIAWSQLLIVIFMIENIEFLWIQNEITMIFVTSIISLMIYLQLYHCFSRSKPNRLSTQDIETLYVLH